MKLQRKKKDKHRARSSTFASQPLHVSYRWCAAAPSSSAPDTSWAFSPAPKRPAWLGPGWRPAPPPWRPAGSGSWRSSPECSGASPAGGAWGRSLQPASPRRWARADGSSPLSAGWTRTGIWGGSSGPATWRTDGRPGEWREGRMRNEEEVEETLNGDDWTWNLSKREKDNTKRENSVTSQR